MTPVSWIAVAVGITIGAIVLAGVGSLVIAGAVTLGVMGAWAAGYGLYHWRRGRRKQEGDTERRAQPQRERSIAQRAPQEYQRQEPLSPTVHQQGALPQKTQRVAGRDVRPIQDATAPLPHPPPVALPLTPPEEQAFRDTVALMQAADWLQEARGETPPPNWSAQAREQHEHLGIGGRNVEHGAYDVAIAAANAERQEALGTHTTRLQQERAQQQQRGVVR